MAEVSPRQRNRVLAGLDLFFFVFGGVAAVWLAYLVLEAASRPVRSRTRSTRTSTSSATTSSRP
jgi:hypothetical protein